MVRLSDHSDHAYHSDHADDTDHGVRAIHADHAQFFFLSGKWKQMVGEGEEKKQLG